MFQMNRVIADVVSGLEYQHQRMVIWWCNNLLRHVQIWNGRDRRSEHRDAPFALSSKVLNYSFDRPHLTRMPDPTLSPRIAAAAVEMANTVFATLAKMPVAPHDIALNDHEHNHQLLCRVLAELPYLDGHAANRVERCACDCGDQHIRLSYQHLAALPACPDCPIGGRDGSRSPTCPRQPLCDLEARDDMAAIAGEHL